MIYLYFFLAIWLFRLILNSSYLLRTLYYQNKYLKYIGTDQQYLLNQYVEPIKALIKHAGVVAPVVPFVEYVGYNQIVQGQASTVENLSNNRKNVVRANSDLLLKAVGAFKKRIFECFSPLYWITAVLFAPRNLLIYLGFDSDSLGYKLCNIIFTLIWWVLGMLFIFYKEELMVFVNRLLDQL